MTVLRNLPKERFFCHLRDLGMVEYRGAYQLQTEAVKEVIRSGRNVLFLCEHPPIFTLGRLATPENILISLEEAQEKRIEIIRIDRGGEVTFHGPGQLVVYPIFQLGCFGKDLKQYMKKLEHVVVDLLYDFDIVADGSDEKRGVFVQGKKIASIGIGVRKWVTFHGLALNVNTDLKFFSMINPCGLDVGVTSLKELLGREVPLEDVKGKIIDCFHRNFPVDFI